MGRPAKLAVRWTLTPIEAEFVRDMLLTCRLSDPVDLVRLALTQYARRHLDLPYDFTPAKFAPARPRRSRAS